MTTASSFANRVLAAAGTIEALLILVREAELAAPLGQETLSTGFTRMRLRLSAMQSWLEQLGRRES